MSKYVPNPRKILIGSNIRAGQVPGGFTSVLGSSHLCTRRKMAAAGSEAFAEATRAFMLRRGIVTQSTDFDCRSKAQTIAVSAK